MFAVIITVIGLFFLYFKYLPRVISLEKHRPQIEEAIKENINLPINIGKLDTSVTWNFGIRVYLSNLTIQHTDKKEFISTGPVVIELSIPAFLQKQILIRKIDVNYAIANIVRLKNGEFDLEQLIPKSQKAKKYKIKFKNSSITLNGYQLYFKDNYIYPVQSTSIIGKNIQITKFDPNEFINIYANGQVLSTKKPNTEFNINIYTHLPIIKRNLLNKSFGISGTIKNLYPGVYLTYINKYLDNKFVDLSGLATFKFDINKTEANSKNYNFKIEADIDELQGKKKVKGNVFSINEQSKFILEGNYDDAQKQVLSLNRAELKSPIANVSISGKIYNFRTKKKILDLKLKTENTRIESLVKIFPKEIKIPKDVFNKLYKHNAKGNVTADIILKDYYKIPLMYGSVKYSDFSVDDTRKNIPGGYGKIDFKDYYLYLDTLTYTNSNETIKVTGKISPLKFKTMNLNIKSNTVDLERGHTILLAIRDILNFKLGPLQMMKIKGNGDISLIIDGPFKTSNLNGYLNVKNGYATYDLLAKYGHDINGKLLFKNDRILYNNINGYVEDSKVIADGYSTLRLDSFSDVKLILPDVNLKYGHEFVFNSPLLIKLQKSLKAIETANGRVDGIVNLKGTKDLLHSNGYFVLKNSNVKYIGFCEYFKDITGRIEFDDEAVIFKNLKGTTAKTFVKADGTINKNQILDLTLTTDSVNLSESRKFIKNSPLLIETEKGMQDYLSLSGNAKALMHLYGNINQKTLFDYVKFYDYKASFFNRKFGYPVNVSGSLVTFTIDGMFTNNMKALALDTPMVVSGKITGFKEKLPVPTLNVIVPKFDVSKTILLSKSSLMQKQAKDYLSKFDNLKGSFAANVDMLPNNSYKANIKINDIQGRYLPWNAPVSLKDGRITVSPDKLHFNNVFAKASKSLIHINGSFYNYLIDPEMDIIASAKVNSDDINDFINPHFKNQLTAAGIIPVSAVIKGNAKKWEMISRLTLNKGANLSLQKDFELPDDKIRTFNLVANGTINKIDIQNMEIIVSESLYNKKVSVNPIDESLFNIKGIINDINTDVPSFEQFFIVAANPIDITLFNTALKTSNVDHFFSEGKIKANIVLNGKVSSPQILGDLSLYNVKIPSKQISIDSCDINLDKSNINIINGNVNVDGSSAKINALLSNVFDYPILVKNITIDSSSLDVDKISKMLGSNANAEITEDLPRVVVTNGILNAQELIISNLITNDVMSNFTFTPDWLLSLSNVSLNTAGGNAAGEILYNLKSTDVSANIALKDMQANAAASTFLKLPNEVYGTLNGKGEFNSKGKTSQEMVANANGFASFNITDGRLVRLGSLEYFLRAINIVQSGVAGFNFNNILDLIIPQNTGNFETLEGTLTVKDGTVRTDNLSSKGKELSLFLSGDIDMVTNNAKVTILGNMSKKVSGLLGPIGSVSINTFIDFIPGIGFLPSNPDSSLINFIPGISRIPGLGLGGSKKTRRFEVKINGNLYDPRSVKSFRWLD
jgi:hypothetical protein